MSHISFKMPTACHSRRQLPDLQPATSTLSYVQLGFAEYTLRGKPSKMFKRHGQTRCALQARRGTNLKGERMQGGMKAFPDRVENVGNMTGRKDRGHGRRQPWCVSADADQTDCWGRLCRTLSAGMVRSAERRGLTGIQRLGDGCHKKQADTQARTPVLHSAGCYGS